jgi:hypothetical protein
MKAIEKVLVLAGLAAACVAGMTTCDNIAMKDRLLSEANPPVWEKPQKITATTDMAANALFGSSVSISANYAIVGAQGENGNNGAAYIFKRNGKTWSKVKRIVPSPVVSGSSFGYSVGIDGDYAIVGAINGNRAYIFYNDGDNWTQQKILTGSGLFGCAVSIYGESAIVGAYDMVVGSENQGEAYIFWKDAGGANNWGIADYLVDVDGTNGDQLGFAVSISNQYAVAGAPGANGTEGIALVYYKVSNLDWSEQTYISSGEKLLGDSFGSSVSLTDSNIVIGASGRQRAYCYSRNGSVWGNQMTLALNPAPLSTDYFASSVAIDRLQNSSIIVAAYGNDTNSGSCYGFESVNDNWVYGLYNPVTATLPSSNTYFGWQVAIFGNYAIIGAISDSTTHINAGAAYIFSR